MTSVAKTWHASLPAGVHRTTGAILSLAECQADPAAVVEHSALTEEQKIALVRARWLAGEWKDVLYGTDGLIDRDRALRELLARSDIGRHLMATELRAIEMVHEDTAAGKRKG